MTNPYYPVSPEFNTKEEYFLARDQAIDSQERFRKLAVSLERAAIKKFRKVKNGDVVSFRSKLYIVFRSDIKFHIGSEKEEIVYTANLITKSGKIHKHRSTDEEIPESHFEKGHSKVVGNKIEQLTAYCTDEVN